MFFEIGGYPDQEQELIITALGNKELFPQVEKLISNAPKLKDWNFIALKPSQGSKFVTRYEDVELDPQNMWFLPLDNTKQPELLGLKLFTNNFNQEKKRQFLAASYILLDTILGERSSGLDISYVDIDKLPENPEEKGMIELPDLPKYLAWHQSKIKKE